MDPGARGSVSTESEWNPDAFSDRDWLAIAADRLLSVTRAVASALSFSELLRVSTEACLGVGGADAAGIYLLDPDGVSFTVGWEATDPSWPSVRPPGDMLRLRDWRGMIRARDLGVAVAWRQSDKVLSDFERGHYAAEGVGSGIDVPLICRGETLGFLKLFRRDDDAWSSRDCTIATMIGSSIALSLTSERLLERAVQQSIDQRALAALSQAAITPREPRELLQRVAEQIRLLLPFPCVDIELWNPVLDRAEIVAHAAADGWPGPTNGVIFYRLSSWPSDLRMLRELDIITLDVDDDLVDIERRFFESRSLVQLHYVPLLYGERCLGAILLHAKERIEIDQRLKDLIDEVAAITALAAHAARSHRSTEWERRAQDWQLRINQMILNDTSLATVLDEALASLVDMTDVAVAVAEIHEPGTTTVIERRFARGSAATGTAALPFEPRRWPVVIDATEMQQIQVRRINDESVGSDAHTIGEELGHEWVVVAPLLHDQRHCGTVCLLFRAGYSAGDDQLSFVRQMARQLALVATSYQLRIEQEYVARRSAIMIKVSQDAVSIGDPTQLLHEIARTALEIDRVDACEIERFDRSTRLVHNVTIAFAGTWTYDYDVSATLHIDDIPTFAAAIERNEATPYLMSDPHVTSFESASFRAIGVESVLVIPLEYSNEMLGVLTLLRCEAIPFSDRTIALANELATHASVALGRARLFEALHARANSDGVTGLANHRAVLERIDLELDRTIETQRSLSLMLIDLDSFKQLNDARGHLTGDRFLREVANMITAAIGDRGEAARYGGDEFLVLLPDCEVGECAAIADRLLTMSREVPIVVDGDVIPCTFSVGTASAPLHGLTRDDLIGHADRAMYDAKQRGGGRLGYPVQ